MGYEMKDILTTMIDNNEPHWSADTMDMVRVELKEKCEKADAFDRIVEEVQITEFEIREKELVSSDVGYRSLGKEIARFVSKEVNTMIEEFGYEVTPQQSLDGLWKTMHKYIEHHGYSDISLEMEGSQYEFRQHLQKYDEYEAKAKAFDAYHSIISKHIEQQYSHNNHDLVKRFVKIHDEYESGGSDD